MFSQSFISTVKNAINLLDLVKEYVPVTPAGNNSWQSHCPHPDHDDSTPSFRIWRNKKSNGEYSWSWACMGCHYGKKNIEFKNYGSDCFAFVQWMSEYTGSKKKLNWRESIEYLANKASIPLEEETYSQVYQHLYRQAISYTANLIDPVKKYLYSRGIDDDDIKEWLIGFNADKRVSFPLFNKYRQVIGFSNRKINCNNKTRPKYKNSATSDWFNKGAYLYGIHLYDKDFDEVRITEGPLDVILSKKYGVQNIFGTLGTSFTKDHAEIIKNMGKIPCFCMDGDNAGEKAARRAIDTMAELGVYSKVLFLPSGMDIADLATTLKYDTEQYIQNNSMTYWQYHMKDIVNVYDAKLNELQLQLYPSIKKIIGSINNESELIIMKNFVKTRIGLEL